MKLKIASIQPDISALLEKPWLLRVPMLLVKSRDVMSPLLDVSWEYKGGSVTLEQPLLIGPGIGQGVGKA
jgi:hypothetical protein